MIRAMKSTWYNWIFNTKTGFFARWGRTKEEDPSYSPIGPELLDIEVSTTCNGPGKPCSWCYKSNKPRGKNMSFETFQQIFNRITTRNLTQIAFGIGDIDANPDLYSMFAYARGNGVIPNVTINGWRTNDYHYNMLARLCGAVSVSHYDDEHCFNAVKELTDRGMTQINIHKLLAKETLEDCYRLVDCAVEDPRLSKLNAIIFLLLKPKGDRNKLTSVGSLEEHRELLLYAQKKGIQFGMDSCSAPNLLKATEGEDLFSIETVEPCESTLFSLYINVDGAVFPCSFTEGQPGWKEGLTILDEDSFLGGVWFNRKLTAWREKLLGSSSSCKSCKIQKGCRSCPEYNITICREEK
jgi:radical SAM protein with 4Fe4S-binding SPASM domain